MIPRGLGLLADEPLGVSRKMQRPDRFHDRGVLRPGRPRLAERRASETDNGVLPNQCEHKTEGNTRRKVAIAEVDADALKPEWKQEYRALFDRLTLDETETAKRTCAMPGKD